MIFIIVYGHLTHKCLDALIYAEEHEILHPPDVATGTQVSGFKDILIESLHNFK